MSKKSKKRNKKYTPKITAFPLGMRDEHKFEIPFLTALDTLDTPHFSILMLQKLAEFGYLAAEMGAPDEWNPYPDAIDAIYVRFESTGIVSPSPDETRTIREISPKLIQFLRERSNYEVIRAGLKVLEKIRKSREMYSQDPNTPNMPPKEDGSDSYVPYGDHINAD